MNIWNRIRSSGILLALQFVLGIFCATMEAISNRPPGEPGGWGFLAFACLCSATFLCIRSSVYFDGIILFSRSTSTVRSIVKNFTEKDGDFFVNDERYRWEVKTKSGGSISAYTSNSGGMETLIVNGDKIELSSKDAYILHLFIKECINKRLAKNSDATAHMIEDMAEELRMSREEYLLEELAKLKEFREKDLPSLDNSITFPKSTQKVMS